MSGGEELPITSNEDIDFDLLEELRQLSPAQRMLRHDQALQLVLALRAAGTKHYGFDPRVVATADDSQG